MLTSPFFQAFFWAGVYSLTVVWGWFRLAETKGRTFEEMDILFQRRVPSRKFASYNINNEEVFEEH